MIRALFFASVGVLAVLYWQAADPGSEGWGKEDDWPYVVWFSAMLLSLAVAVPAAARLAGGSAIFRTSLIPAGAMLLSGVANIIEDGLNVDAASLAYVTGAALMLPGLLALTAVVVCSADGARRLLAIAPAGTVAGFVFLAQAGGVLLLVTWLAVGALALALGERTPAAAVSPAQ
jgi:hypothetical protein